VVTIELCGEVRLEIDGRRRERDLPGRLGRVLLGYLTLNRHRVVPRDELIEALWPKTPPEDPGVTLSTLLSGLRRTLGPERLSGRGQIQLILPEDARVDVEQAVREEDPEAALDVLERILLPDFDAPWLDQRRRELEDERLAALERVARGGDPHRALSAARRIIALAPYRESGYALLMEAQEAQGNVAEALRTFETLRALMRDELGAVPSEELRGFHARLLRETSTPRRALPPALARAAERRFVGREAALQLLRDRLADDSRHFVFLAGEPGIGKTSLAAAFAREAPVVLYGRSDEEALTPYQPFVEMLAHAFPRGDASGDRYRLFEAVVAALARIGSPPTPLVLVCDDLHWADRPTLQLIRHLSRAAEPKGLLFIGTYRDAEAGQPLAELIADLRREHVFEGVPLSGLDEEEASGLLAELPESEAKRLYELSRGHPLFLGELLADGAGPGLPAGIKEVVLRRVARLEQPELLSLAAVAGHTFPPAAIGVEDVVDPALAAGLLTETSRPGRVAFSHALIRQTLYEELSETRRARLHEQVARALEAQPRRDAAELAHHYFRARAVAGPRKAVLYAREAAERAAEALAWEDEALQLERALEADTLRDDPAGRTELLLALGDARTRGGHAAARAPFAEAASLARGRSPEQLARAAIGYGGRYYEAGIVDLELIELLREALAAGPPEELRIHVLARLAEVLHFAGDCETSIELSQEAVTRARELGDEVVLIAALTARQISLLHVEHVEERIRLGDELLAVSRAPRVEMQVVHGDIHDRMSIGDIAGARLDLERLDQLAHALRDPLHLHFAVGWRCMFAQLDGRLDEAEQLAMQSYEMRRALETRDAEGVLAAQLFMIRRAQGRVAELLDAVEQAIAQFPALAAWRAGLPLVLIAAGEHERARAELARVDLAAIPRDFFWLVAMSMLAEATAALRAPAGAVYDALLPYAARFVQIGYAACDGPVSRSLGLLAASRGDTRAAIAHLEAAVRACAGAPGLLARAETDLASARAGTSP
jgi:DNA-binding SARP family transcriptional activator